MTTWIKVARIHLVDRVSYTALPWAILGFDFFVLLLIAASLNGGGTTQVPTGALASIYIFFAVAGALSIFRSLPFALALGISRRSYYAGTALLAITLAVGYGVALAVLSVLEGISGGWGLGLRFFRIDYILPGPWYLTWLTSSVVLALMFIYGMWFGLVYRRWNLLGVLAFVAGQVIVVAAGVLAASETHGWPAIGHFFTTIGAFGLTGLLAALMVVLLTGGYVTMRRATV